MVGFIALLEPFSLRVTVVAAIPAPDAFLWMHPFGWALVRDQQPPSGGSGGEIIRPSARLMSCFGSYLAPGMRFPFFRSSGLMGTSLPRHIFGSTRI